MAAPGGEGGGTVLCFRPHEAFVPSPPHPPFHSRGPKPPLPPSVRPFRHPAGRPGPLRAGQRPAAVCGSSGAASAVIAVSVGVCHIGGGGETQQHQRPAAPDQAVPLPAPLRAASDPPPPNTGLWDSPQEGSALTSVPLGPPRCSLGLQSRSLLP